MPVFTKGSLAFRDNTQLDDATKTRRFHTSMKSNHIKNRTALVHTKSGHTKDEILPWIRYHSYAYCKQKAESLTAWLLIHFGIYVKLTVAERHFETCPDFQSDQTLIMYLASEVTEKPKVFVAGDGVGITGISCLNELVPEKLYLASQQSVEHHDITNRNLNEYLSVVSTKSQKYAGASIRTDKQNYDDYMHTLKTDRITSHNSHPWFFLENLAKSGTTHLDVTIWLAVWDRDTQQKYSEIQDEMNGKNAQTNYDRTPDDIFNYLKFYQHETSPEEQVFFFDKFILDVMSQNNMTCEFIVITFRGKITDKIWQSLKDKKSRLAMEYTRVFQIEELPHAKEGHMKYNKSTGSSDIILDSHNIQPEDQYAAERGRFFQYIFRKKKLNDRDEICEIINYECTDWYSRYFNSPDVLKQAVYVKKDTLEKPCERISIKSAHNLKVLLKKEFDALNQDEKSKYIQIDPLRRKIKVEIEDLKFFSVKFHEFLRDCKSNKSIEDSRTRQMKVYMGQFEYRHKMDESIKYNDEKLIQIKKKLFDEVHTLAFEIKKLKHWKLEPIEHASREMIEAMNMTHQRYTNTKNDMNSLLLQLQGNLLLDDNVQYTLANTVENNDAPEAKEHGGKRNKKRERGHQAPVPHFEGGQGPDPVDPDDNPADQEERTAAAEGTRQEKIQRKNGLVDKHGRMIL